MAEGGKFTFTRKSSKSPVKSYTEFFAGKTKPSEDEDEEPTAGIQPVKGKDTPRNRALMRRLKNKKAAKF